MRAQEPEHRWQTRLSTTLPLATRELFTEALRAGPGQTYRLVLSGTIDFAHNGRTYDALYTTDDSGRFTQRHAYVVFSPRSLPVVEEDAVRHRYVFLVPPDLATSGKSIGVMLDVPRIVKDFILPPDEVVRNLSGEIRVELQSHQAIAKANPAQRGQLAEVRNTAAAGAVSTWWLGLLGLAASAAIIAYVRSRHRLAPDLRDQLRRIRRRYGELCRLVRSDGSRFEELSRHVSRLREGGETLAGEIHRFRRLQRGLDANALRREIETLQRERQEAQRDDLRQEIDATLAEKRRLLSLLEDTSTQHSRYVLRLAKVEAALESTRLAIPKLGAIQDEMVALYGSDRQQAVLDQIQSEIRSVEEALDELREPKVVHQRPRLDIPAPAVYAFLAQTNLCYLTMKD